MKNWAVLILLLLTGVCTTTLKSAQVNIAVIDLIAKGVTYTEASAVTDRIREGLVKSDSFRVFERDIVDRLMAEQGLQHSGIISDESMVQLGKMIGVEQIVSGSLSQVNKTYTITLKLIDVETGEILKSVSSDHSLNLDRIKSDEIDHLVNLLSGQEHPDNPNSLLASVSRTENSITPIQIAFIDPVQIFNHNIIVTGLSIDLIYGRIQSVYGISAGVANRVDQDVYGIQAGLINRAKHVFGIQAGLVNITDTMFGLQVGLLNTIHTGMFPFLPFLNAQFSLD